MAREQLPIYYALIVGESHHRQLIGSNLSDSVKLRFSKIVSNYANNHTKRLIFHTAGDFFQYILDYKEAIGKGDIYDMSIYNDISFMTFADKSPIVALSKAFTYLSNESKEMILGTAKHLNRIIKEFYLGEDIEIIIRISTNPNFISVKARRSKKYDEVYFGETWSRETSIQY